MRFPGFLFALLTVSLSGQHVFDFEDASLKDWQQLPEGRWERTTLNPIEGGGSLHHAWDNPASGVDQIARLIQYPDLSDTLSLAFRVRHGYPPSSGNNWQLFFLASGYTPSGENKTLNSAMIFGVNYSGYDDHLKLWHLIDGDAIEILDTGLDYQQQIGTSGNPLFIITRVPGGKWEVGWQINGDADVVEHLGEGVEIEPQKGKYMGFRYAYSSSQDRKLWLDEITLQGRFYRDTTPPRITDIRILGLNGLEIRYNEPVLQMDQIRYSWNLVEPDSVFQAPDIHRIYFKKPFPNREVVEVHVSGIRDLEDNVLGDTVLTFRQDLAAFGDVIISEIMSDPDPAVYLPACEFVELLNRYNMPIRVGGWHIEVNNRHYEIQAASLQPGGYLVLTHSDCNGNYGSSEQQGILTSSTALVNGGGVLRLKDRYGRLIHYLDYKEMDRYGNEKTDGGWSLERIDPDNLCGGAENWKICDDEKGGTPGKENSHQQKVPDANPPQVVALGVPSGSEINIVFNEPILIHPGDNTRFSLSDVPAIPGTGLATFAGKELLLTLKDPPESSLLYQLRLENISDCAGNIAEDKVIPLVLPSAPVEGAPVINEIMYDPVAGGNEYIELYNDKDSYYDLFDLQIELREPGSLSWSILPVSATSRLLFPGEYVVLCRHEYKLNNEWMTEEHAPVISVEGWKQLPDGGACIRLANRAGRFIDQVCYHDTMHHDQLQVTSGVSLERVDADCKTGPQCWTSAASSENYGTPGFRNSQSRSQPVNFTGTDLKLTPEVFSPDGDGVDDYLQISFGKNAQGDLVDLFVTDLSGRLISHIVSSGIAGSADHYYWYGEDLDGRMVLPGIYVIHQRRISTAGNQLRRAACAVVYR